MSIEKNIGLPNSKEEFYKKFELLLSNDYYELFLEELYREVFIAFNHHQEYVEKFNLLNSSAIREEYLGIFLYVLFALFLGLLIVALSYFLVTQKPETEKLSTYECGFEPYEDGRNKFHIRFYVVAILFILFDIEIIYFLPWCASLSQLNLLGFWSMVEFLLELNVGFMYVWNVGAIEWD